MTQIVSAHSNIAVGSCNDDRRHAGGLSMERKVEDKAVMTEEIVFTVCKGLRGFQTGGHPIPTRDPVKMASKEVPSPRRSRASGHYRPNPTSPYTRAICI